ncbi:MAG: FHA domain-containing protein [bacterium]|nr:FHA domain-containing protein [bacterium]
MATLYVLRGPDKGRTFETPTEPFVLGRQSDEVPLSDNATSREHARLKPENGLWLIEDLHSSNGTFVNGQRIHTPTALKHGDRIKIGGTLLVFGGDDSVKRYSAPGMPSNLVEYAGTGGEGARVDSSILSAIPSCEDSVILAAPETAEAVHAWKLMYQIAEAIGAFVDVGVFLERVTDLICEHFVFDRVLVLVRDPESNEFVPQAVRHRGGAEPEPRVTASHTILNHVRGTKNGILCANAMTDQRFAEGGKAESIHSLGLRSVLCVPIIAHDDVQGIIHLDCAMGQHTYTHEQLRLATAIGRMTGMAIENARLLQSRVQNERLAAMGETVAYLSHHIRNILQGLHSGSDVLELGIKRESMDTVVSAWKIIQRNLDRTLHLATNMLSFSTDRKPAIQSVDLNQLVEDVIALTQRGADDVGVMVLTNLAQIPAVLLDKDGVHQAILNLVRNAIEACPSPGGRVMVTTAHDPRRSVATISITDDGPGIEADQLPHIFEPFRSTKGHGGTGLGLAAARKVIRESDGELEVETDESEGTTFRILVPTERTCVMNVEDTLSPADPQTGPTPAADPSETS